MNGHQLVGQHQARQMSSSLHHHLIAAGGVGVGPMELSIKRESQHWSLPMLSGVAGASGLSSGGGLVASTPSSSDAAAIAAAAAAAAAAAPSAATLHGLDVYAVSNAMLNNSNDDLFVSKAKTPKLELQNGHLFGEMSPDGMNNNPGSVLNGGMNENSPASSSSSLAAAAAALMHQANQNGMGGGLMCNGLGGRANSLSMDGGIGDMSSMLQRAAGATTSLGCPPGASGLGGGSLNDNDAMQPRQRRKVPEGELCAVCSDRATGYHYGVASCNGCKTFFRRTIVSDHQFVCQYQGKCDVNKNVRCACRYCRFQKCVAVGMDQRAIQNDRDRIGPTKKFRLGLMGANGGVAGMMGASSSGFDYGSASKRNGSLDEDQLSVGSMSPTGAGGGSSTSATAAAAAAIAAMAGAAADSGVIKRLVALEELTNQLRKCVLDTTMTIPDTLRTPSLLGKINELEMDPNTLFTRLYPAALNDIQLWNVRELKICFEWAKAFDEFTRMSTTNQFFLLKHVAFAINILNRLYYSLDHGPDKIVYPTGAFITREPQSEVIVPGCCSVYQRQMDEIMTPLRRMGVSLPEFATFKAILLFNPDALNVSPDVKPDIARERTKYLQALFYLLVNNHGMAAGVEKYGNLLMMAPSLQNIINQNNENMQVMELFGNFWRVHSFVKELCLSNPKIDELPPEQQDRI